MYTTTHIKKIIHTFTKGEELTPEEKLFVEDNISLVRVEIKRVSKEEIYFVKCTNQYFKAYTFWYNGDYWEDDTDTADVCEVWPKVVTNTIYVSKKPE